MNCVISNLFSLSRDGRCGLIRKFIVIVIRFIFAILICLIPGVTLLFHRISKMLNL